MKLGKNLKIKKKLLLAFLVVALIGCASGIISAVMSRNISSTYDHVLVDHGFAQGDIGKALATFCRMDGNVHDAINYQNNSYAKNALVNVKSLPEEFESYMAAVKPTLQSDKAKQDFANVMKAWGSYKTLATSIAEDGVRTNDPRKIAPLQERLVKELDPLYMETYSGLFDIMQVKVQVGQEGRDHAVLLARTAMIVGLILIVLALALSCILGTTVASGIAKPMDRCCKRLLQLSEVDLQSEVPETDSEDEVGQLTDATGTIVRNLNEIIGDIDYLLGEMAQGNFNIATRNEDAYKGDLRSILLSVRKINRTLSSSLSMLDQSAEQVASGADQVSTGAQSLAQGATEQASAVEELSATISEIGSGARKNAETCQLAIEHSNLASGQVDESSRSMEQMVAAMKDIHDASVQIGNIIATIENIAFQTNILALNAAVEAARAGSAGKGFAVVADEVRNLASRSDEAAKATKVLIENAISAVQKGETNLNGVSTALDATVQYSGQVIADIQAIAASAAEQSEAISQVTEGIDQISSVVQTNSATSEESAAASEELSGQAALMKEEMRRFTLRRDNGSYLNDTPETDIPQAEQQLEYPDFASDSGFANSAYDKY